MEGKSVKFSELQQCGSGLPVHKTSYPATSYSSREVERPTNILSGELGLVLSLAVSIPVANLHFWTVAFSWPTFQMLEAVVGRELPSNLHIRGGRGPVPQSLG